MVNIPRAPNQAAGEASLAVEKRVPAAYYRTLVRSGYSPVNGYEMYYEIHGTVTTKPLVLSHTSLTDRPAAWTRRILPDHAREHVGLSSGKRRSHDSNRLARKRAGCCRLVRRSR